MKFFGVLIAKFVTLFLTDLGDKHNFFFKLNTAAFILNR